MANISLLTANRLRVVIDFDGDSRFPNYSADEAISPGTVARMKIASLTTGGATPGNASSAAESTNCFLCVNSDGQAGPGAGAPVRGLLRGIVYGFDLSGMTVGDIIYLSDTDGRLATTAGTVSWPVGQVIAGNVNEGADKLAMFDFTKTWNFQEAEGGGATVPGNLAVTGTVTVTSASASALTVGRQGATNPALKIDASAATSVTGVSITAAAAAGGVAIAAISSGAAENLTIDAKGSGTITLGGTSTGNIVLGRAATGVSLAVTGAVTSSGGGIGYATGAGGTVTQMTNKSTGVTLSKLCGTIVMNNASLAADTTVAFTLTNTFIDANDIVVVVHDLTGTIGAYSFGVTPASGSALISVHNNTPGALGEAIQLRFFVFKGVVA